MADLPIASAASLTGSTIATGDLIPVLDISAASGSKGSKITVAELFTSRTAVDLTANKLTLTSLAVNTSVIASTGYALTGSNATGMIDLAGTLNTSGAPSVIKLNITNTASSMSSKLIDIQLSSVPMFSLHRGVFAGTNIGGQGIAFGDPSADTACSITSGRTGSTIYFGCTQQFGLDMAFSGAGLRSRSGYLFQISSDNNSYGTPDIGFSRNAAGVLEINSGTAGTFRDLKTRNAITNPVTVAGLAGAVQGARSFVTDASTTLILGFGTTVTGGGSNKVPVYYDGTNWLIG